MKFKYKDEVEIISGFYLGQEGTVYDHKTYNGIFLSEYDILLKDGKLVRVEESDLAKILNEVFYDTTIGV